jgi:hypothetical protein
MGKNNGGDAVQLLVDTGVLSIEEAAEIKTAQVEVIIDMMLKNRALMMSEVEEVRFILNELNSTSSRTRRVKSQMELVKIITSNLHRRIGTVGDMVRSQRNKITSGNFPAVSVVKTEAK